MAERLGRKCLLVELGSGSSRKTRILLDALREPAGYVPIDISREHLLASAATLRARYPGLEVLPVHADYTGAVEIPRVPGEARRGVFFPGSTIGNFHHDETVAFLRRIADLVGPGGGLLVGADLKKDPAILHRAYNDSAGVTARFNRNILARLNRELGCDFDVDRFRHRAFWDEAAGRIEMHLDSLADQVVHVGAEAIALRRGESIWTESSYKYSVEEFGELAARGGLRVERVWTDGGRLFSVQFLAVRSRSDEFR
jgi:dimethylhistidine N-methyltransferase